MPDIKKIVTELENGEYKAIFDKLYGSKSEKMPSRYIDAANNFSKLFNETEIEFYSAPGRTEVGGNHTDHQHGCVLAAGVDLDVIAAVSKNDDNIIRLKSEGYDIDVVDLSELNPISYEKEHSPALIRGICARFKELGFNIGGFNAYTTSNVLKGSGLSSSAAFEVLVCTILSHLYNDGKMDPVLLALISQYSENKYFGKPCGLMDQTACSVGGFVAIDFNNPAEPKIEKVDFDFNKAGHSLCIVDTGGSHADLTNEYAAVPGEMKSIAELFGKKVLRDVNENEFFERIPVLREKCGDRAVLRAIHFFDDNKRAGDEKEALQKGDFNEFLKLVKLSGLSSQNKLQNIFATVSPHEQGLNLALAVTERILKDKGAFRVHGGGFAGTIQAFVPNELLETYKTQIESIFGEGKCHVLSIRPVGGIKVEKGI